MRTLAISLAAASLLASTASPAPAAAPMPVTTCGQIVTGVGELVADLDCSATADDAVYLTGRLLLNGFTLTGASGFDVVRCATGQCRVVGPGTVTGGLDGVRSEKNARVEGGAVIAGNGGDGVRTDGAAAVFGSTITENGGDGVRSKTRATVVESTVSGNGGDGVRADGAISIKASAVDGNGSNGVDSDKTAKAKLSSITGNGEDGIRGLRVTLADSTVTGNGTSAVCGVTDDCADVAAERRPAVRGTSTCGTSRNTEDGGTWGVCTND